MRDLKENIMFVPPKKLNRIELMDDEMPFGVLINIIRRSIDRHNRSASKH